MSGEVRLLRPGQSGGFLGDVLNRGKSLFWRLQKGREKAEKGGEPRQPEELAV